MTLTNQRLPITNNQEIKVWVLAPSLAAQDANIDYYYDFSQSIVEYEKTFASLGLEWVWQPVTLADYTQVIGRIVQENCYGKKIPVVFNLCDGDEINGTPGISVVKLLEEKGLVYTGADEYFYRITTSKIPMKKAFDRAGIASPLWKSIPTVDTDIGNIFEELGSPVIVKPAVSGGSMGVGIKNVVHNTSELSALVKQLFAGYRNWNLAADGLIAESFIAGPEFTVLISGSCNNPKDARIYMPVERVFHASLPEQERFLSFDRLWEIYEEETPMPNQANFYEYALPDSSLVDALKKISWDAYAATGGCGYTRADIRMDKVTGRMYVLEVNAQCGLSEDEDYTSIGAILRFNGTGFITLVSEIIFDALHRHSAKKPNRQTA